MTYEIAEQVRNDTAKHFLVR